MSEYCNIEYHVLKWATDKLCIGFRSAHKSLCRVFFSKDLLTMQVEHMCNDNTVDRDTFVQTMVTTLQDRVRNDPTAYYTIIDILKNENGISYLGDILDDEMIAERKKMTEIEAEKKQRELEIMEAEKKHQKLVEDERVNAQLHYQDTTALRGHLLSHRPKDLLASETEATCHQTHTQEERNARAISPARSSAVEFTYMMPHIMPFGGQKQVSCTEGGDTLPLTASVYENLPGYRMDCSALMKPTQHRSSKLKIEELEQKLRGLSIVTGTEYQALSDSRLNYDMPLSFLSHDQTLDTHCVHESKDIHGNEVTQSNAIDKSTMLECISEDETEKKKEMQCDEGWKECEKAHGEESNEETKGGSQKETWAMESTRRRSGRRVSLSKPTNIYGRSTSVFSDNSDIFETPKVSLSSSIESPTSAKEPEKLVCSNCQILSRKMEDQRVVYLRQLNFRKHEREKMHIQYEIRHQEMASELYHLTLKLQNVTEQMNMKEKSERVMCLISEHDKQKEMQKMKEEIRKLKKEKEKAERENEWAKKELDWAKKELDQAERERDQAEKEIGEERSLRLEMELHYIGGEQNQYKDECKECVPILAPHTCM